jgi:hypothetical protein
MTWVRRVLAALAVTLVESGVLGYILLRGLTASVFSGKPGAAWFATGFGVFWVVLVIAVAARRRIRWLLWSQALPLALVGYSLAVVVSTRWTGHDPDIPW